MEIYYNNIDKQFIIENHLEFELIKEIYHGKNIKRYETTINIDKDLIIFPYDFSTYTPVDIDNYPNTLNYFKNFKEELKNRKDSGKYFKDTNKIWFEYWDPKPISFKSPKIICPDISNRNNFFIDLNNRGFLNTCYGIYLKKGFDYRYILGILNSSLIEYFIKKSTPFVRGGFNRYKTHYLEKIPLVLDENNKNDLISLVNRMLKLHKDLQSASDFDRKHIETFIKNTDKEIDNLVYELYGLTPEEIKIVEGK